MVLGASFSSACWSLFQFSASKCSVPDRADSRPLTTIGGLPDFHSRECRHAVLTRIQHNSSGTLIPFLLRPSKDACPLTLPRSIQARGTAFARCRHRTSSLRMCRRVLDHSLPPISRARGGNQALSALCSHSVV